LIEGSRENWLKPFGALVLSVCPSNLYGLLTRMRNIVKNQKAIGLLEIFDVACVTNLEVNGSKVKVTRPRQAQIRTKSRRNLTLVQEFSVARGSVASAATFRRKKSKMGQTKIHKVTRYVTTASHSS